MLIAVKHVEIGKTVIPFERKLDTARLDWKVKQALESYVLMLLSQQEGDPDDDDYEEGGDDNGEHS